MYITNRFLLKYGMETDPMEVTTKEHKTFEKAYAYAKRYARGLKFVSCTIENKDGKVLYEIFNCGADEEDYRTEEEKKLMEKEKVHKSKYKTNTKIDVKKHEKMFDKVFKELFKD